MGTEFPVYVTTVSAYRDQICQKLLKGSVVTEEIELDVYLEANDCPHKSPKSKAAVSFKAHLVW